MFFKVCLKGGAVVDVSSKYVLQNKYHYIFHNSDEKHKPETEKGSLISNRKVVAVFDAEEVVGIISNAE